MPPNQAAVPDATPDPGPYGPHEPIAIIGVGLRFPGGSETLADFGTFLREGRSGIRPVPEDRWNVSAFSPAGSEDRGKVRTTGGGFLDRIDTFDSQFFNISPKEAAFVDPQQRIMLETAWRALEDANLDPAALRHGDGGVYIGTSQVDYALELDSLPYEELDGHLASGITAFPISGRVSYVLGWRGPSMSIDTACASSLTALHLAVSALRRGDCRIALAGGVNIVHHPRIFVMFSNGNMLAPDGQCKTFDESADGYSRADGAGALILKRLGDAQRDGDRVLALIRGTAVGHNGESAGLTVPNGNSQERVIRDALDNAGLTPGDIQYVEAHGTGTPLGDPIEMSAICDVFSDSHSARQPLAVASVKTNCGHAEAAAGVMGVVKTVLQMRERTIFPHLNLTTPSPRIPWDRHPVTVPTECLDWQAPVRRAAVNSFGFAGAIAAAVLEEAPAAPADRPQEQQPAHVFTLSAKLPKALSAQVEAYRGFLEERPDLPLADLCYTANVGRSHFPHRLAAVVHDREELAAFLDRRRQPEEKGGGKAERRGELRKTAFLFTGQGSQYPGMGAALYEQFPLVRRTMDECDRLFAPHLGRSVLDLLLDRTDGDTADGDTSDGVRLLDQTLFTQPALFTLEYALAKLWLSFGVRPNALIGHSIGEVVAAAVADVFSLEDAVALVAVRARLMQSVTVAGGMVAVDAPAEDVEPLLSGRTDIAVSGRNAPGQCSVSGSDPALAEVGATLTAQGRKVTRLAVSHAFHSPLMAEVYEEFREAIAGLTFREPVFTLISNVTGKVARPAELMTPEYWVRHIGAPVDFLSGIRTLDRRGRHVMIELGPASTLSGLARASVDAENHRWLTSLHRTDTDGSVLRASVAQFYATGLPFNWSAFHEGREARKADIPHYVFDRKRHWLPVKGERHGLGAAGPTVHPLLGTEITTDEQRAEGLREFAARVSSAKPAWAAEHTVGGKPVLPGTGYLEILFALQDAVFGENGRPLRGVAMSEALFLPEEGAVELRTRLREQPDGSSLVEIVSLATGAPGGSQSPPEPAMERVHTVATIAADTDPDAEAGGLTALLEGLVATAGEPEDVLGEDEIYAAYAAAGLDYGPAFRRMHQVSRYGADLAVGVLRGERPDAAEQLPPAVLDAATHAFGALGDDGNSYLPVGFDQVRLLRKPRGETLRSVLRRRPARSERAAEGVDLLLDLVLLDGDRPVCEVLGLALKRVAEVGRGRRHFLHELHWRKRSLVAAATSGRRRVLVVGRSADEIADLVAAAGTAGVAVTHAADAEQAARLLAEPTGDAGRITDVAWYWSAERTARTGGAAGPTASSALPGLRAESERNYRALLALLQVLEQHGFGLDQRLWLLTEQAQQLPGETEGPDGGLTVAASSLWGFGQVVLNEYPSYRTTMVDLPVSGGAEALIQEWTARDSGEFQIAFRGGQRHVRRLAPMRAREEANFELAVKEYGQFSGIKRVPCPEVAPVGDQIQVELAAVGLNFKDVLNALGMLRDFGDQPLGFEGAGTVVAVGPDAAFEVGEEVIVNYLGLFKRRVTVPSAVAVRKPAALTMTEAAGLISVYVTAYYSLHRLAGIKAGDRVLVHAAAGGVGQAAVQLARLAGAEIFATASPHKWPLLRAQGVRHLMNSRTLDFAEHIAEATDGAGVDIVLNSLNKDFIDAGLRVLAPGGRFVELGKVGIRTPEQMAAERPDAVYHTFDLSELPEAELLPLNQEIMAAVVALVESGELPALPTTVYSLDEVEEAFGVLSRGANLGKLVLSLVDREASPAREVVVRADRSYLVTGGLGALGLVTAHKLVDLGARHLVLAGRRAEPVDDVAHLFKRLRARAEVTVVQADLAEAVGVSRLLAVLRQGPQLGGVIHSAGTIDDKPVSALDWESIDAVFRAKVYGTVLLHEALAELPALDFLVAYSSGASVVGALSQGNYAAANAFLDDLMRRRAARGLPGLSINWGPWAEVGMSARLGDQLIKRWADEGVRLFTPARGTRTVAALLGAPVAQVLAGECDWDRFTAARPLDNALYRELVSGDGAAARGLDLEALLALTAAERAAAVEEFVRARAAAVLHIDDLDGVPPGTPFGQLGLDSLMSVELKNGLESAFRVPLPASVAFDHPSAGELAEHIDRQLLSAPTAAATTA